MVDEALLKAKLLGVLAVLVLMTITDSVFYIVSVAIDGGLALIAVGLLWSIFKTKK